MGPLAVRSLAALLLLASARTADIWGNTRCGKHQKCPFGLDVDGDEISRFAWGGPKDERPAGGIQVLTAGGDEALVYDGPFALAWKSLAQGVKSPVITRPTGKSGVLRTRPALSPDKSRLFAAEGPWAGSPSDRLHAVNTNDGSDTWTYSSDGSLHDPPILVGQSSETLVIGQRRLPWRLAALNASDGSLLWNVSEATSDDDRCDGYASSPVASMDGATLVCATMCVDESSSGMLRALSAADGTEQWVASHPDLSPIVGLFGDPDVTLSPDGTAGFLWARAAKAGEVMLYAFSMDDGHMLWNATAPAPAPLPGGVAQRPRAPVVSWDGATVFTVEGGTLVARDARTEQEPLWRGEENPCSDDVSPVLSSDGQVVFFATNDHHLCGLHAEDGQPSGTCIDMNKPVTDLFVLVATTTTTTTTMDDLRIRLHDKFFCLETPGGEAKQGKVLWLSDCIDPNGPYAMQQGRWQQWVFNVDTRHIHYAAEPSLCVDIPGGDVSGPNNLWLWECSEDNTGQRFSYKGVPDSPISVLASPDICWSYDFTSKEKVVDLKNCTDAHGTWDMTRFSEPLADQSPSASGLGADTFVI